LSHTFSGILKLSAGTSPEISGRDGSSEFCATITGMEANSVFDIRTVRLASIPYNHPMYFHKGNTNTCGNGTGLRQIK
jgi:hypothetical protein